MAVIEQKWILPRSSSEWQAVIDGLPPGAVTELKKLKQLTIRIPLEKKSFAQRKQLVERTCLAIGSTCAVLEVLTREGKFPAFVVVAAVVVLATHAIEKLLSVADKKQLEKLQSELQAEVPPELFSALDMYPHLLSDDSPTD